MFLKNDPSSEKRYYNGMIGEVAAVKDAGMLWRGKDNGDDFSYCRKSGAIINMC